MSIDEKAFNYVTAGLSKSDIMVAQGIIETYEAAKTYQPVEESKSFDGVELYALVRKCVEHQTGADETAQKILDLVWPHITTKRESAQPVQLTAEYLKRFAKDPKVHDAIHNPTDPFSVAWHKREDEHRRALEAATMQEPVQRVDTSDIAHKLEYAFPQISRFALSDIIEYFRPYLRQPVREVRQTDEKPEEFDRDINDEEHAILKHPIVQSLLYDINLLPEQITQSKHWFYMLSVLTHMDQAMMQPVEFGEQKPEQIKGGPRIWHNGQWWKPERESGSRDD